MRLDLQSMFSDGQTLSGTSVTSTKTLDIGKAGFVESTAFVVAHMDTASHGVTSVALQGSADGETFANVVEQAVTDTVAGTQVNIRVPQGCPRYLKLVYKGASMQGKVTAGVTLQAPSPRGHRVVDVEMNARG
jgi:hypothetical protein